MRPRYCWRYRQKRVLSWKPSGGGDCSRAETETRLGKDLQHGRQRRRRDDSPGYTQLAHRIRDPYGRHNRTDPYLRIPAASISLRTTGSDPAPGPAPSAADPGRCSAGSSNDRPSLVGVASSSAGDPVNNRDPMGRDIWSNIGTGLAVAGLAVTIAAAAPVVVAAGGAAVFGTLRRAIW